MRIGRSAIWSSGYSHGPSGTWSASHLRRSSTPWPRSAEIMKVLAKLNRAFNACVSPSSTSDFTRSILLIAKTTVRPVATSSNPSSIRSTPSLRLRCASINSTITSASAAPPHAAATIARSSLRRGWNRPGVSTNTNWLSPSIATPRIRARVVCTLWVTMLTFAPTIRLRSVDLPALGSPIRAMNPARVVMMGSALLMSGRDTGIHPPAPARSPLLSAGPCRTSRPTRSARLQTGQQRLSRRLFGLPLGSGGGRLDLAILKPRLDGELRLVIRAGPSCLDIGRRCLAARLRPFLQGGLGVARVFLDAVDPLAPQPQHHGLGHVEPRIAIDRSDHRLHRIAQQGLLAPPPRQHLRAPQLENITKRDLAGHVGTGFLAHQRVEARRQQPLFGGTIPFQQRLGHHQPQHPVAQKLQPLIVVARGRGHRRMRHRPNQQRRLLEPVSQPILERLQLRRQFHRSVSPVSRRSGRRAMSRRTASNCPPTRT